MGMLLLHKGLCSSVAAVVCLLLLVVVVVRLLLQLLLLVRCSSIYNGVQSRALLLSTVRSSSAAAAASAGVVGAVGMVCAVTWAAGQAPLTRHQLDGTALWEGLCMHISHGVNLRCCFTYWLVGRTLRKSAAV